MMMQCEKELREAKARLDSFKSRVDAASRQLEEHRALAHNARLARALLKVVVVELAFDIQLFERLAQEVVSGEPPEAPEESRA